MRILDPYLSLHFPPMMRIGARVGSSVALIALACALLPAVSAQRDEPITALNVDQLRTASRIDFADLDADFQTGWFAMDESGGRFLVHSSDGTVWLLDDQAQVLDRFRVTGADDLPARVLSAALSDQQVVTAHTDGGAFYLRLSQVPGEAALLRFPTTTLPVDLWLADESAWLELMPADPETDSRILQVPLAAFAEGDRDVVLSDFEQHPYAPGADASAAVRIGRIQPPAAVTSSVDGEVRRWNLQTGEMIAAAEVTGGPAVFGNMNADGTHLAWRNPQSEALYLLDFASGTNQLVDELSGQYAQFYFLTAAADAVLAVNLDFQPLVIVWDVATGQRHNLGTYRDCGRVPDMARLSMDGTTLVIGCDAGLDIWRLYDASSD